MGEYFGSDGPGRGPGTGGTTDDGPTEELLDLEGVYAVLDHPRRQRVVDIVDERDAVSMNDLAAAVAAREEDVPASEVAQEQRRSVAIALHHVHVPKLAEVGVITLDDGEDRVEPGPRLDQVVSALGELYGGLEGDRSAHGNGRPH